jgi:gamma-glutamyl-gamma-aminobutyrate hydrolase PuuD
MRIGLSQKILNHNGIPHDAIDHGWYTLLNGHSLYFLPNTTNQDFAHVSDNLDSLILTGGESSELRNSIELSLANKMIERGKPVVGIAQGGLAIADILGATLEPIKKHVTENYPIIYHGEVIEVTGDHRTGILKNETSVEVLCTDYNGYTEAFIKDNIAGLLWNPERMQNPWIPPEIALLLRI